MQFIFAFVRSLNFHIYISRDERVVGGELRHVAGLPGGGGHIRFWHTLFRVHTVWMNNNNMSETQCQRLNTRDSMSDTQYHRLEVRDSMSVTQSQWPNVSDSMSEIQCQRFIHRNPWSEVNSITSSSILPTPHGTSVYNLGMANYSIADLQCVVFDPYTTACPSVHANWLLRASKIWVIFCSGEAQISLVQCKTPASNLLRTPGGAMMIAILRIWGSLSGYEGLQINFDWLECIPEHCMCYLASYARCALTYTR